MHQTKQRDDATENGLDCRRCPAEVLRGGNSHLAYPDRLKHDVALKLFSFLVQTSSGDKTVDSRGQVESLLCTLLGDFRPPQKDGRSMQQAFFCGESQIFLCAGALEHLREISQRKIDAARIQLQSFLRCQVRRFKQDRRAVLVLQCTARCRKAFAGRCNASVTRNAGGKHVGSKGIVFMRSSKYLTAILLAIQGLMYRVQAEPWSREGYFEC